MKKKLKIGIVIILLLIGMCYIYFFKDSKIVVPCVFHKITGLYCPGCGITRCLNALLHLEFYQAFRYNALVVILLPFIIFYVILLLYNKVKKRSDNNFVQKEVPNYIWYIILIITLLFGVLRNISYFEWLAPTII